MTLFIIVVMVIVGYLAYKIYIHDNTIFYKMTGYSYFDVLMKKKVRILNKIMHDLEQAKGARKVMINLQIPVYEEIHSIDALLLHESGIYVVNIKDKSGWINGREQNIEWKELLHKNKIRTFNNPIHETKRLINALQDQLPEVDATLFETVVVFTNDCSFQQIEIHSENVEVLKMSELNNLTKTLDRKRLTEADIETLFSTLEGFMTGKNSALKSKPTVSVN
ncbi:nuclease-related domain-containing protein [Solibacillus merdavium]|uniref:NERD domain-containing protein n=1 Tax=Solibacillus merdavium TaxID=2762218 RepID=A0ABR8XP53_9BACL|nr:nuclease-related domain-containing protein [Solibacillus merdavium]MBD8033726.1 NERD domain-containing protein [Solibacillus merdavium]